MSKVRPRVLSGIRPTGSLHLGNYLGALRNWVLEQERSECYYTIVDLHALVDRPDPADLKETTLETAIALLSIGIDPGRSVLFVQSQVRAHAELTWYLACLCGFGELRRMTQFKEKATSSGGQERASAGLFFYPVLMAADILLYRADRVPVGEDQVQHLELTRTLAQRFNKSYGNVLVVPEPLVPQVAARVMDLQHPTRKMSKSEAEDSGIIYLFEEPDSIRRKVRRAVTDSARDVAFDPKGRPGVSNLLQIVSAIEGGSPEEVAGRFSSYKQLKEHCAELVIAHLAPFRSKAMELRSDPGEVQRILKEGARRASEVAEETLARVKAAMGCG